jgi:VWFA-related protein
MMGDLSQGDPLMRTALILVAAGSLAFTLATPAEDSTPQQPQAQPAFRSGVDLVQVDVSVLDRDRQPVRGLTAADFTVREDGKVRPVEAFSAIELPARPAPTGAAWLRDVAPDVATNAIPRDGRLVVILFDRTIRNANRPAARLVAEAAVDQLGPADLAAVIYTSRGVPQNFTGDRRLLMSAIAQPFMGLPDNDPGNPGECRCGVCSLETMTHVADALRDVPQRRKMLLFIGSRLPVQTSGIGSDDCGSIVKDARTKLLRAVDVANLTIHTFDSNGLETLAPGADVSQAPPARIGGNLQRQGDLAVYPSHTGGRAVMNTNAPAEALPAVFAETRSYYVLGFAPANPKQDGHFHDIKVDVARRDVSVHPRLGYYAPSKPEHATPAGRGGPPSSLVAALASLWPRTGLPLNVSVAAFANPGKPEATVAVVIRAHESLVVEGTPAAGPVGVQKVNVLAGAYDRDGKAIDYHVQTIEVTPRADPHTSLDYEVVARLALKPGRHEVRVAAENVTRGTSGSVYTYIDVPDFNKARLSISGIVLGPIGASTIKSGPLGDLLPLRPVTAREFAATDRVAAFVRVYQGSGASSPATLTTRIVDSRNQSVFEQRAPLFDAAAAGPKSADHEVTLPLEKLSPGEYLLTFQAGGQKPAASRDMRFTVK